MPSVFELLDEIERRPSMFLGRTNAERAAQLRDLEILLMGYGHAVVRHAIDDIGGEFLQRFGRFLADRNGWSMSAGPFAAVRTNSSTDEEAWQQLWCLIREFRQQLSAETG